MPLAELGSFPLDLLLGEAMVFDQHTHVRFRIAPAIERAAPPTDANRMVVVLEWMLAVLSNQLRHTPLAWTVRPVSLTLTVPGGGGWSIAADGTITAGLPEATPAIGGNREYGERFLDAMNVV